MQLRGGGPPVSQVKRVMISLPDTLLEEVDGIAAAEQLNRSEFIREAMKLYISERKRRLLREQMKRGYLEMAKINLALALENYRLEAEAARIYELPFPGGK
jgi:CopG family transcriptional regulator/antitoxin EndoAI